MPWSQVFKWSIHSLCQKLLASSDCNDLSHELRFGDGARTSQMNRCLCGWSETEGFRSSLQSPNRLLVLWLILEDDSP